MPIGSPIMMMAIRKNGINPVHLPGVGDWVEEIHPKKAGQEGDRHEQGGDHGEGLHDVVHAVVNDREVGIQGAAYQVAQLSEISCSRTR